jgi:uncharacterized membrane protein
MTDIATLLLRWLHLVGACVLLGTGIGIAFFSAMAHRTREAAFIARTAEVVVIADWLFTATAVVAQPITGALLAHQIGWRLSEGWIALSLALYVFTGLFWLPVVWLQHRMRDIARGAVRDGAALPPAYHRLFKIWFLCGFPAFFAVLAIVWLMASRPAIPTPW